MEIGNLLRKVYINFGVDNTKACQSAPVGDVDLQNALQLNFRMKLNDQEIILRAELESSFYFPVLNPVGVFNPNAYDYIITQQVPEVLINTTDPLQSVVSAYDSTARIPIDTFQQNVLGINQAGVGSLSEQIPNNDPLLLSDYIPSMSPTPGVPLSNQVSLLMTASTTPHKAGKFDLLIYNSGKVSSNDIAFTIFANLYPKINGDPASPDPVVNPLMANDKNRVIASYNTLSFYIHSFKNV